MDILFQDRRLFSPLIEGNKPVSRNIATRSRPRAKTTTMGEESNCRRRGKQQRRTTQDPGDDVGSCLSEPSAWAAGGVPAEAAIVVGVEIARETPGAMNLACKEKGVRYGMCVVLVNSLST